MNFKRYLELSQQIEICNTELDNLTNLIKNAAIRLESANAEIADAFSSKVSKDDDLFITLSDQEVLDKLNNMDKINIFRLKPVASGIPNPLIVSMEAVAAEKESELDRCESYIIQISVGNEFDRIEELKDDIRALKSNKKFRVYINAIRDSRVNENKFIGGIIIPFNEKEKDDIFQEYFVDGVSSNSKKEFVEAVIGRFIGRNKNLTYAELSSKLSKMGNRIINDLDSIKEWRESGHVSVWSGKVFDSADGLKFKVYNQWKKPNFRKVIEFARLNDLLDND